MIETKLKYFEVPKVGARESFWTEFNESVESYLNQVAYMGFMFSHLQEVEEAGERCWIIFVIRITEENDTIIEGIHHE